MSFNVRATFDHLRSLAFGSISGTYAKVGPVFSYPARVICLTNNTDGDMFWSIDGINDYLFTAAFSFKLIDVSSNAGNAGSFYALPMQTQMWVRQSTMPTKGSVYVELVIT